MAGFEEKIKGTDRNLHIYFLSFSNYLFMSDV